MTLARRHPIARFAAAALVATAVAALSPDRAAAACGDHVTVGGQPQAGHDPGGPSPAPRPCDGPSCSGKPTAPLFPPAAPVGGSSGGPEWATTPNPVAPASADGPGRPLAGPAPAPPAARSPRPVFHPPRPA